MESVRLVELVREHRDEIQAVVARHRGLSFAVFGSAARGDDIDIDLLVRSTKDSSPVDLLHRSDELERILGWPSTWCQKVR